MSWPCFTDKGQQRRTWCCHCFQHVHCRRNRMWRHKSNVLQTQFVKLAGHLRLTECCCWARLGLAMIAPLRMACMHSHLGHDGALMHCEAHNFKAEHMICCMPAKTSPSTERCCRQISWVSLMHQPQGRSANHPSCDLDHAGGCLSLPGHTNL